MPTRNNIEIYRFKLFFEGVEIPNNLWSAQISSQVNGHSSCVLSVVPTDQMRHVLPRALVHIFWYHRGAYRTIFAGEVLGYGFDKTRGSRSCIFQCQGFSSYWDRAYRTYFDPKEIDPDIKTNLVNVAYNFVDFSSDQYVARNQFIKQAFQDFDSANPDKLTMSQSLFAIFDKMRDINAFFKFADNRLSLISRIFTLNNSFSSNLLSNFAFSGAVSTDTMHGTVAALSQTLEFVLARVFFQRVSLASPCYVDGREDTFADADNRNKIIDQLFFPEVDWTAPPRCNVVFPEFYGSFSFSRNFMGEPTRTQVTSTYFQKTSDQGQQKLGSRRYYAPKEIAEVLRTYPSRDGQPGQAPQDEQIVLAEEVLKGIVLNFHTFQGNDTIFETIDPTIQEELTKNYGAILNFLHARDRLEARTIESTTGRFNPFAIPGLPMLFLDQDWGGIIGQLVATTHSITGKGRANTAYSLARGRVVPIGAKPDYVPQWDWDAQTVGEGFYDGGAPLWYDENLKPESIGEMFYAPAFGVAPDRASIMTVPKADGKQEVHTSVESAVSALHSYFFGLPSKIRYKEGADYIYRDIPTEYDAFANIGARPSAMSMMENMDEDETQKRNRDHPEYYGNTVLPSGFFGSSMVVDTDIDEKIISAEGPFLPERKRWAQSVRSQLAGDRVFRKD